jgi:hypothetical protein
VFWEKWCAERGAFVVKRGGMRGKRGRETTLFGRRKMGQDFEVFFTFQPDL